MKKPSQLLKETNRQGRNAPPKAVRVLSEAELDHVAAAGSKPGGVADGVTGFVRALHDAPKPHP